uniref:GNAT family N-acetyltransferase n=1 Tax=Roseihalotalea indica TaxID=2867963 RepID=A0AA49GP81_9BACT|nr:GNAT family N-acetyltransferase [Tunicatimonas sp. TK19036]
MKNISIIAINQSTDELWDYHWEGCSYATFFHARGWYQVWERYEPKYSTKALHVRFSDGKAAVMPASISQKTNTYIMSPGRTYGGWISADELTEEHASLLYDYLKGENIYWRINPYDPHHQIVNHESLQDDDTNVIPLQKDFDELLSRWSSNHKKGVKKGLKENQVKLATTKEEWQAYFSLYQKCLERWGENATSNYSWELFDALYQLSSDHVKLWLTYHQDMIIGGGLCFYGPEHVVCWHSAVDDEYFSRKPIFSMFRESIAHACEQGYRWYDFNPSGGHEGVKKFKQGFATIEMNAPVLKSKTQNGQIRSKIKRVFAQLT